MGIVPILQIRRMLRERSARDVSLGYFAVLLIGFLLWITYGLAATPSAASPTAAAAGPENGTCVMLTPGT